MKTKTVYITVRLDIESTKKITDEIVQDVVSETDYSFLSKTDGVTISNTEICGINEEFNG